MPVRDPNWCIVSGLPRPPPDTVRYWDNPRFPSMHMTNAELDDIMKRSAPISGRMPRHLIPALDRLPESPPPTRKARQASNWRDED